MATLAPQAIQHFNEWKLHGSARYLTFRLNGTGQIAMTKEGPSETTWDDFVKQLDPTEPCWVTYSLQYKNSDGDKRTKLCLIQWIPSRASIKDKLQYAMWSKGLKTALAGVYTTIQAGDVDDLDMESVMEKLTKFRWTRLQLSVL